MQFALAPSCSRLWALTERECTFTASSSWPVAGLEAGPAYLYYPRLVGATATAEHLTITCPPDDWDALLLRTAPMQPPAAAGSNLDEGLQAPPPATSRRGLVPCGTATVSSGAELLAALERLQPGHARLLISLVANISLPVSPTPQRADPVAGDDDDAPLVVVYRNVTLVGGGRGIPVSAGGSATTGTPTPTTELDLNLRRNTFGLAAGWQRLLQQQEQPLLPAVVDTGNSTAAGPSAAAVVWRGRPVLVMADLALVNSPPGPPASWPVGMLGIFHHFAGIDRNGSAGLQLVSLRCALMQPKGLLSYVAYWYGRAYLQQQQGAQQQDATAWLQQFITQRTTRDADDGSPRVIYVMGDYYQSNNSTYVTTPLRTAATPLDFDLWSPSHPGLLQPLLQWWLAASVATNKNDGGTSSVYAAAAGLNLGSAAEGSSDRAAVAAVSALVAAAAGPLLPPSSFALAGSGEELLALLQEAWSDGSGGPRVIILRRNITLQPGLWPPGGAVLSYNVTLEGPVAGAPVRLDTAGLPLVQRRRPLAAAAVASTGGGGGNPPQLAPPPPVYVLLERLVVAGWTPPLMAVPPAEVAAAAAAAAAMTPAGGGGGGAVQEQGAATATAGLLTWMDRCLAAAYNGTAIGGAGNGSKSGSMPTSSAGRAAAAATIVGAAAAALAAGEIYWEARNCTFVLPAALQRPSSLPAGGGGG
ncbi:hypothetical protein GPECTOR_47g367 [Gonium pectorale]|uniref:Uncharacterized protein n=1 Tax=Gonium pectorale TaxID=33097 RepID=A0A150G8F6_GONPE|nr:hypothetical protein GPECTOR_47g367 [Gonium pectorale]|eukprot:KXZ46091.1 hypothetical protein GPECTOR_47g367 [Gonium pectorale]